MPPLKLSYLMPTNSYGFFQEAVPALARHDIDVQINYADDSTDLILACILPQTPEYINVIRNSAKPCVLWHWDLYSFVDYQRPAWREFLLMMEGVHRGCPADIWSGSYETARQLKEVKDLDSHVMPAWINSHDLTRHTRPVVPRYVLYVSTTASLGKREEWAVKACELLGLKLETCRGQALPRQEYLKLVGGSSVYLMTAFEESNGSIPALEAAVCGAHLVIADIPSNREVFGPPGRSPQVHYFDSWSFGSLLEVLRNVWISNPPPDTKTISRLVKSYDVNTIAARMADRLKYIVWSQKLTSDG